MDPDSNCVFVIVNEFVAFSLPIFLLLSCQRSQPLVIPHLPEVKSGYSFSHFPL